LTSKDYKLENEPVMRELHEVHKAFFAMHRDNNRPFTPKGMEILRALRSAYSDCHYVNPEAFTARYATAIAMARATMEEESK
jgi:hypothetical protein